MTLVDTNVLLDVVNRTPHWFEWADQQLQSAALRGPLWINDVIYAEFSVRFARSADVDRALEVAGIDVAPIPRPALFVAGQAFAKYRKSGGTRTGVLPDFFIGAHAAVSGLSLLTRDTARYRTYFPRLELIAPD